MKIISLESWRASSSEYQYLMNLRNQELCQLECPITSHILNIQKQLLRKCFQIDIELARLADRGLPHLIAITQVSTN